MEDWDRRLRAHGYRITPQRQLVLNAVYTLRHGTPEEVLEEVQRHASGVNLSTIYRAIEVLEEVGLVTHSHIGHGAPTYHAVDSHTHIHLACDGCGSSIWMWDALYSSMSGANTATGSERSGYV